MTKKIAKKAVKQPTLTALRRFAALVADLVKDGECLACGKDGFDPNPKCNDHEAWDMPNDDAVDTLHYCINEARKTLGRK